MNSLVRITNLSRSMAGRHILATTSSRVAYSSTPASTQNDPTKMRNFDPNNYDIPIRPVTMNDTMEPYGSWKVAYEAEKRRGNRAILLGVVTFALSLTFFLTSHATDGIMMPNLDNIMEETHPYNEDLDKTDRRTV